MLKNEISVGRRVIFKESLSCHILPGKFGELVDSEVYSKIFSFWKQQWEPVMRSVGKADSLHSDEFLRQFEIIALSYESDVVGVLGLDLFDLDNPIHLSHSYFSWLNEVERKIFHNFGFSFIINQLAVSKLWRGGFGAADLLVGLAVKRMENSPFQRCVCYTRNQKKTDSLAHRWGARPILTGQLVHNEPSTYFEFEKNCYSNTDHPLKTMVEDLWSKAAIQGDINLNKRIPNKNSLNRSIKKGEIYDKDIDL
ncbi:MAG: hypothetical protein J0M15_12165 [Deltaproteobacteria bacterium]|jgi:hypothetical protein|nr:hypothetical protein [Deltaproteobacteria bacterium]